MPLDPTALAEARALVASRGMSDFSPSSFAPTSTGGTPVPIELIDSFARAAGVPIFDKPDPERPGIVRSRSILDAIRDGQPLPPVVLFQRRGWQRYELYDGFHRLHLFAALGYTHIMATITDWKPGEY